jgi:hypothetical protein
MCSHQSIWSLLISIEFYHTGSSSKNGVQGKRKKEKEKKENRRNFEEKTREITKTKQSVIEMRTPPSGFLGRVIKGKERGSGTGSKRFQATCVSQPKGKW